MAQHQLTEIMRSIEARRNTEQLETLEAVFEYKQQWTVELQRSEN